MALPTAPARQNLPVESDSLVGRDRDLSDLLRLLESDRTITLTGADGVGKTRLALRLAAQASASFADGVWLAALADLSTRAEVAARISGALGITEEARRDPVATLCDALSGRALLLVLDGYDGVPGHVAEISAALASSCPSVSLLLTGREPLRIDGETVWRVPPLPVPPPVPCAESEDDGAVRLFLDRARTAAPGYAQGPGDLAAVNRLCHRLEGIPLAIELAAAWAGHVDSAGIDAGVAAALEAAPVPAGNGSSRARVLDAVVGWSHSMLGDTERVLLRRLSVFPNWCLELAEQVCAEDPLVEAEVLDLLSGLLDRSLITLTGEHQNRVRYRLLDPVRRHARARLAESGEGERIRARHTARMIAVAEDLGAAAQSGRPMPWAERFAYWDRADSECDNIRAALHWSAQRGNVRDGLRICAGMRPFWFTGYHFAEGCDWAAAFLALAQEAASGSGDTADPPAAATAEGLLGEAVGTGETGGSAASVLSGRTRSIAALRGRVMVQYAELAWPRKRFAETAEMARVGAGMCRAAGDWETVCLAQNILALLDSLQGRDESARERIAEVLELARASGDLWNEAVALNVQGSMAAFSGAFAEADMRFNTALMIMRGMDHRWGVGSTLMAHGAVAEANGDPQTADRCYREAMDIQRSVGASPELAACLAGVGRIAQQLGSTAQAYDYLGESLQLSHSNGQHAGLAEALASIASVAERQGRREPAARCAGAAAALAQASGWGSGVSRFPQATGADGWNGSAEDRAWFQAGSRLTVEEAVEFAAQVAESGRVARPRPAPARPAEGPRKELTPREREVAELVGAGHSNRAISERLYIAPATAARHVANINRKLGFNSRDQIAAWMNRHAAP
ncbi:LuxR family transcriptional regulator [Streptomonospora sediminis]